MGDYLVDGIPLTLLTLAIVQWIKELGVTGNAVRIVSLLVGVALGASYKLIYLAPHLTPGSVFEAIIFGLALGLSASGLYDVGKSWRA